MLTRVGPGGSVGLQVGGDTVTLIGADGLDGLLFQNGHAPLRIPVGSSHSVVELV